MIVRLFAAAREGARGRIVEVQVRVRETVGQPKFTIIGLGDGAIRESRDRIVTALRLSGFKLPTDILVNLAPGELRKEGTSYDLAIATGILVGSGQLRGEVFSQVAMFGELALDGVIKPVRGVLGLLLTALHSGIKAAVVPASSLGEAALIKDLESFGVESLRHLVEWAAGRAEAPDSRTCASTRPSRNAPERSNLYLDQVVGQPIAKRGLLIAAAGGHNILFIGPPGCGKSMLAERLPTLLPSLSRAEMLEVATHYSFAGLDVRPFLDGVRPFRAPHHTVSDAGLLGGGHGQGLRPGEITLAHRGVLFLDEFPEYRRSALESLRTPLERGAIVISRARDSIEFPADFQLVAAMNPCPCGRGGGGSDGLALGITKSRESSVVGGGGNNICRCSPSSREQYWRRLSQPILERIDLHVRLDPVSLSDLMAEGERVDGGARRPSQEHLTAAENIARVRALQLERSGVLNARLDPRDVKRLVELKGSARKLLGRAHERFGFSARSLVRIMRLALTIADLAESEFVTEEHLAEALGWRRSGLLSDGWEVV